ncbi:MAG: tetratricopeptide repeat protein [Acidobacteria bacterium]|nr:tetratricopeptide repeat protein [Acidobacteriota bacterium]
MPVASSLCGAGAKEVIAGAPLLVWIYDATFLAGNWRTALRERRFLYAGFLLTWAVLAAVVSTGPRSRSVGFGFSVGWWDYLKTQSSVILHYLSLAFWPHPLSIDYGDYPIATSLVSVLPQALVIVALLGVSIWCLRKRPALGFLGAWFFIVLAPSSSFVPIVTEPAAERRMYLPLIAAVTLVFYGVYELTRRSRMLRARWLALASAGLITVILAAATHRRNSDYRTEITIWSDVVKNHPNYAGARNNLGLALLMEDRHDEGLRHLLESIRLNPRYTKAHQNLGFAYSVLGRHSEAIQHHKEALRYDPNMTHARYQLATEYLETGDSASARNELEILKTQDAKLAGLLAAKLQN